MKKKIAFESEEVVLLNGFDNFYINYKHYNNFKEECFTIEKADSSFAGFGDRVIKVSKKHSKKFICYINSKKQLFFINPVSYNDLTLVLEFVKKYNLIESNQENSCVI